MMICKCSYFVSFLAIAAMAGCVERQATTQTEAETHTITVAEVRKELEDAAQATKQIAAQTQQEYLDAIDTQVGQLDQSIAKMQVAGDQLAEDAKAEWRQAMETLEAKRAVLEEKRQELANAGQDAWQELTAGIDAAWQDIKSAAEDAAAKLTTSSAT